MGLQSEEIALAGDCPTEVAMILPNGDTIMIRYDPLLPSLDIVTPGNMLVATFRGADAVQGFNNAAQVGEPAYCNGVVINIPKEMLDS